MWGRPSTLQIAIGVRVTRLGGGRSFGELICSRSGLVDRILLVVKPTAPICGGSLSFWC